ncbi:hypothetical protein LDZ44_05470 [Bacteroides xylanisolvens]|uniref:hypothetical protein n=1 Tax=Bacteroides xylanisolvens TaxID=371601 RepID=UPI001CDD50E8|nr:hypothetical protein [Bacteroides xylanisolvens]MCA4464655.1 hypothetical protein [Bacteroides xylanisolvens]MCA4469129.1 hypothetical protein [Bacteroides xylanisolvens]MCA4478394.1 hypothetical protein [Bacteroides xylanisolvens]MCA4487635.1 hypothetical protein [Bacteroides xylanisolvens]MCA4491895.1 hypothetical protein [Bacteroides xylanisolvens]
MKMKQNSILKALKIDVFSIVIALLFSLFASSCGNEIDENDVINYTFGISSATSYSAEEQSAIETAYIHAYKKAGIKYSTQSFAPNTKVETVLKACKEAEDAIFSSSMKFDGSYTYEIFEITSNSKRCIYRKTFGIYL